MKPIRVEWVPSRAWRVIWGVAAVAAVGIALVACRQWQGHQTVLLHAQEQQNALLTEIDALKQPPKPFAPAFAKLRQQVQGQLLVDLNPVFATIEGVQLPSVQLRGLNVDSGSGVVRVEYMLDSVAQASLVSEKLNTGYDKKPWALTGVGYVASAGASAVLREFGDSKLRTGVYAATWVAQMTDL